MEKLIRDSYGSIDYINAPYLNTGSVANIDPNYIEKNKKLHENLKKTSDLLDNIYKKHNVLEKIINGQF
ncbi:CJH_07325 family protein [Campylobacter molothri]|uniref:CJH_07325 family protein n=1 Tax=Campylobacter molothri TaxID=1032242 RepID=UPI001D643996|nr:CJH_07325 family protein [Campylobacter sp. W0045]